MDVTQIPFNRWLGIRKSEKHSGYLLELNDSPELRNHLGTIHASVQLALAEAASGEYLLSSFPDLQGKAVAVVRRMESKFKSPLNSAPKSKASASAESVDAFLEQMRVKGRGIIRVDVEVGDDTGAVGLHGRVEWFVQSVATSTS